MRTMAGVVTDVSTKTLVIQLEAGTYVETQKRKGFKLGTKCWVSYDFGRGEIRHLYKDDPMLRSKQDTTKDIKLEKADGEHGDITETNSDSEALPLCSDGWEFWDSDSGILELSGPCSGECCFGTSSNFIIIT